VKQLKIEGENLNQVLHECEIWHHNCGKEKGSSVKKHYKMNKEYEIILTSASLSGKIIKDTLQRVGIYAGSITVEKPKSKQQDHNKQNGKVVRGS
jgi:hypothetical protein